MISSHIMAARAGRKPTPRITVSEWADQNRWLSTVSSKEPGRWRTDRTPYLREIMDCLSESSPVQTVVAMMASQLGKTEVGLNWIGSIMDLTPGPILMVQPTLGTAEKYSKQRLDPMIAESPTLKNLVSDARSRDSGNTMLMKEFRGGLLCITGANSSSALASMPIRFVFLDEVDRFTGDVGGEGDPVGLALRRTNNFGSSKKILLTSTPTIKGFSRIEKAFLESDQRYYWVPCPHCKQEQVLVWSQIKWPDNQTSLAYYICIHCESEIQEYHKTWMLANGRWIASSPGIGKAAGFHLNGLYCPLGWHSWGDIAHEFVEVHEDPFRLKQWTNTILAETWEEDAERLSGDDLLDRREDFGSRLPPDVVLITAGIDVQDNRLEVEFVGWGRDEESWSIDHRVIYGDPSTPAVWQDIDSLLRRSFPHSRQTPDLHVRAATVDTGGHFTQAACDFCRPRQDRRIWGIKGMGGAGRKLWPTKPNRSNKGRIPLFAIGVDTAKEAIYARLRIKEPGPGYCHFPRDRDSEWFNQLTAESVVTRYVKGRQVREWFKKSGDRNEALDCRVYAMAALHGLISMGLQINREAEMLEFLPLKSEHPVINAIKSPVRKIMQKIIRRG
ncbi:MAG: phage terminase large subunit family protein [Magnetococcus sp. YQC-5]